MTTKFLTDNMFLIAVAVVSGAMLVWPMLRRTGGAWVDNLQATMLVNKQDALMLDVREPAEFANGRILNARNIPVAHLENRLGELEKFKDRPVIVHCATGQRAGTAVTILKRAGFASAVGLTGGFPAWKSAGLPVEK